MRTIDLLAAVASAAAVVAGCAAAGPGGAAPAPVMPPIHDTNIVPGRRAGPISIGMNEAQLFQAMGNPTTSTPSSSADVNTMYRYGNVSVWVGPRSALVNTIWVGDPAYRLPSGVHVGSSSLEVKALLGTPAWSREINPFNYRYCFPDGTAVELYTQQPHMFDLVSEIIVCGCNPRHGHPAPGCFE